MEGNLLDMTNEQPLDKDNAGGRRIVGWFCNDNVFRMVCNDIDTAIEEYFDTLIVGDTPAQREVSLVYIGDINVYGFAPQKIEKREWWAENILREFIQSRFKELLNPNDDDLKITPAMRQAANALVDVICREFVPWSCEVVKTEKVNALEWVKKNRPDWLSGDPT